MNCPLNAGDSTVVAAGTWVGAWLVGGAEWWRTTSVGCTLLLCSSRFRNLLRTRRIAIIVPLLPTILLGLREEKPKIAILRPLVF